MTSERRIGARSVRPGRASAQLDALKLAENGRLDALQTAAGTVNRGICLAL
jgi:hypothetical protein